jgi:hypothetical protein
MALEGLPRSIRLALRIDVQHNPRDLAPVGTFRIRIEQAMSPVEMELGKYRDIERERRCTNKP